MMDLGPEERALLDGYLEPLELEAGQPLFDEGDLVGQDVGPTQSSLVSQFE